MRFEYRFFTIGLLLTSVSMIILQQGASAFKDRYDGLELNSQDNLAIESTIKNEPDGTSQEFVYIVQVEDEHGYVVFLSFQNGELLRDGEQELTFNWPAEKKGTFAIRSFVWSGFDNPVPQMSLTHESRIAVNGEDRMECSGSSACITGIVTKVVDGDTLDVGDIRIRLAIVNTPEIGEVGYDEATVFTSTICPVGSRVLVDEDDGQPEGSFGRMIAKVTCGDNKMLNAELLSNGHANILPEFCAISEFATEDWVQEHGCVDEPRQLIPNPNRAPVADAGTGQTVDEGVTVFLDGRSSSDPDNNNLSFSWIQTAGSTVSLKNANTATPSFTAPSVSTETTLVFSLTVSDGELTSTDRVNVVVDEKPEGNPPPPDEEMNCDPSYPDVCIPSPPPDLNCGDISYKNFKVLAPDPHRFDGDKDGVGCES